MLNFIQALSKLMNATGCELQMLSYIEDKAKACGLSTEYDDIGNLIVKIHGVFSEKKRIFLSCTVDVCGFVCLAKSGNKAYLAQASAFDLSKDTKYSLFTEQHKKLSLCKDEKENYFVRSKEISVGDYLKISYEYSQMDDLILGRFAGKYALIDSMLRLFTEKIGNDIVLCFAVQGEGAFGAQANAVRKYQPDYAVLLGTAESSERSPLIVIKDGKAFSDKGLVDKIKSCGLPTINFVSSSKKAVTKAEQVISSESSPTVSLALPYHIDTKGTESFSVHCHQKFTKLIKAISNLKF